MAALPRPARAPRARLWQVDPTSNLLVAVPGGNDGPGGVLVCSENFIVYKNHGHADKRCALPRRRDLPTEHGLLLVASAVLTLYPNPNPHPHPHPHPHPSPNPNPNPNPDPSPHPSPGQVRACR